MDVWQMPINCTSYPDATDDVSIAWSVASTPVHGTYTTGNADGAEAMLPAGTPRIVPGDCSGNAPDIPPETVRLPVTVVFPLELMLSALVPAC